MCNLLFNLSRIIGTQKSYWLQVLAHINFLLFLLLLSCFFPSPIGENSTTTTKKPTRSNTLFEIEKKGASVQKKKPRTSALRTRTSPTSWERRWSTGTTPFAHASHADLKSMARATTLREAVAFSKLLVSFFIFVRFSEKIAKFSIKKIPVMASITYIIGWSCAIYYLQTLCIAKFLLYFTSEKHFLEVEMSFK